MYDIGGANFGVGYDTGTGNSYTGTGWRVSGGEAGVGVVTENVVREWI